MNFQTSKRIICCLMAALILCCAVVRPIEVSATAVLPALPVIAGVSTGTVVAAVLAALGVGFISDSECKDYVDRVVDAIPTNLLAPLLTGTLSTVPVAKYNDITYVQKDLVDFVLNFLIEPTDRKPSAVYATGYELTPSFQDISDQVNSIDELRNFTKNASYTYTFETNYGPGLIFSQYPITHTNDGSSQILHGYGSYIRAAFSSSGKLTIHNNIAHTGTWTGSYLDGNFAFGLGKIVGFAAASYAKITGNLAPDLDEDEEYQAWLNRQQFFVVEPDNDGDGEPDDDGGRKKQAYLPIRFLEHLLDNNKQNQNDAQSGAQTDTPPEFQPNPGVVASPDQITEPEINPDPDPNPNPNPLPDPDPVPGDIPAVSPNVGPNDSGADIPDWLRLIYQALVNIMLNIIVQIEQLQYLPAKIANAFEYLFGNIQIWIYEQIAALEAVAQWIGDKIDAIGQELVLIPAKIEIFFTELGTRIETAFQWIWEHLAAAFETLGSIITTAFEWIWQHLATAFQNVIDTLNTFWQNLKNWMQTMADYLLNGLRSLFIPDKDYISDKVKSLRNRFAWIDPIMAYFDGFAFDGSEPPIIYIHLDDAEGSYYWGETIPFLDMRWYSRYKATGDLILSGFLWALFAWRMYLKLPGTISGISGTIGRIGE